jgi:DNA-binding transcriptional LysR family regulator
MINMKLDPRHLKILLAVVRQGSFSAAAHFLNMTQPSISIAISQLEDRLGTQVVVRDRKGASLTKAGEILARHALAIESILDGAVAEINAEANEVSGPIIIGGTTGAFLALVPPILAQLQKTVGDVDVTLIDIADEKIENALRTRELTFAVCSARHDTLPYDLEEIPLQNEPFVLVSGPEGLPKNGVTLAEVSHRTWLFPRIAGETKRRLEAVFISAGLPLPKSLIRCDMLATQKEILRQGNAVALLPKSTVATDLKNGVLSSTLLINGPPPRRLVALKLRSNALPPLAEQFVNLACGAFGDEL